MMHLIFSISAIFKCWGRQ